LRSVDLLGQRAGQRVGRALPQPLRGAYRRAQCRWRARRLQRSGPSRSGSSRRLHGPRRCFEQARVLRARLQTTARRSGSIRNMPMLTSGVAARCVRAGSTKAPSRISVRRCGSIPAMLPLSSIAASPGSISMITDPRQSPTSTRRRASTPDNPAALTNRGLALERKGETAPARASFQAAVAAAQKRGASKWARETAPRTARPRSRRPKRCRPFVAAPAVPAPAAPAPAPVPGPGWSGPVRPTLQPRICRGRDRSCPPSAPVREWLCSSDFQLSRGRCSAHRAEERRARPGRRAQADRVRGGSRGRSAQGRLSLGDRELQEDDKTRIDRAVLLQRVWPASEPADLSDPGRRPRSGGKPTSRARGPIWKRCWPT